MPVTPRVTRLVRSATLSGLRRALVSAACSGSPLHARDRLVVVPTRAAASYVVRTIEAQRLAPAGALVLPDLITPRDLVVRLAERLPPDRAVLDDVEREVLLASACRAVRDAGCAPPFALRAGLVAEMLRFYDDLRRHGSDLAVFERLTTGRLEPGAEVDRGAERLLRQTRFLVAAFRDFERRVRDSGIDEHGLRARLIAEPASRPVRHIVVTVGDASVDRFGLQAADWDLLTRLPGLERLEVLVTDMALAGAPHERFHTLLPGLEEVRCDDEEPAGGPTLRVPSDDAFAYAARDREEEVASFVRRAKACARRGDDLSRFALVVDSPLPYVYVAREVCRSGGVPLQTFDALPLAAEPPAAALDLVFDAVAGDFTREAVVALLASPHFRFRRRSDVASDGIAHVRSDTASGGPPHHLLPRDVAALDHALAEAGYLGGVEFLRRCVAGWRGAAAARQRLTRALRAGELLIEVVDELHALREPRTAAAHLTHLLAFLQRYENVPPDEHELRVRHLRARGAVLATLHALREAHARHDPTTVAFDDVAAAVRRWLDTQTFSPRVGDGGIHLVDAESARFGDFDDVQLAGLVQSEWPRRPPRNIFYPAEILRDLGWPSENGRRDAARARFLDLLHLPRRCVAVSTFALEEDTSVPPSVLLDELDAVALDRRIGSGAPDAADGVRIFEHEALALAPVDPRTLQGRRGEWAAYRASAGDRHGPAHRGMTQPHVHGPLAVSALERYQDCPFRFFASDVLGLEDEPEDGSTLTPRARGRLLHEVFQQFFQRWSEVRGGAITPEGVEQARAICEEVAGPLLARLPDADAALERRRLFGSAIAVGAVDVVLAAEVARPAPVRERWLEYRLEGEFALGASGGPAVALTGVADRIDLLEGRRLRVIDYKSGRAPDPARALQAPVYALCARERLEARDGGPWAIDEAAYISLAGRRAVVPVLQGGDGADEVLAAARTRVHAVLDGIGRGAFPAVPHDPRLCRVCAFGSVCRSEAALDV